LSGQHTLRPNNLAATILLSAQKDGRLFFVTNSKELPEMTFWIGVLIGAMGGTTFGALIMAIAAVMKRADDEIERDTRVRQMSDTINPVQAGSDLHRLQVLAPHQDQRRSVV
jgi:hypothetical protein